MSALFKGEPAEALVEARNLTTCIEHLAASTGPGDSVAVAGTGRGYTIDDTAPSYLLAGDESALPAISLLLPALPATATISVIVEVRDPSSVLDLTGPTGRAGPICRVRVGPTDGHGDPGCAPDHGAGRSGGRPFGAGRALGGGPPAGRPARRP